MIERQSEAYVENNRRLLLQLCCNSELYIMNTFFQNRDVHTYTWCRDSLNRRSIIDFFTASADLFRSVLDVRVKRGAELWTNHHLAVCNLHLRKTNRVYTSGSQTFFMHFSRCSFWNFSSFPKETFITPLFVFVGLK